MVRQASWVPCVVVLAGMANAASNGNERVRLPVTRDTWVSAVGAETNGNNGGSPRLKLKSIQEMTLLDIDPSALRGRVITKATLHVKLAGPERLWRVSVSTVSAEWVEGTASDYEPQVGSSTFSHRIHPHLPWSYPGSDFTSVVLEQGGSIWRTADASDPDAEGWQTIPVDPMVVAARVAGLSRGFLIFDDTGSEWARQGEKWTQRLFPNRFIHSRESGDANAPYVEVEFGEADHLPPAAPSGLHQTSLIGLDALPEGEAIAGWTTPADNGPAGTIGFHVKINGYDVPRYLIPAVDALAHKRSINRPEPPPGDLLNQTDWGAREMLLRVRDLPFKPGEIVQLTVRAVDAAGNVGPEASCDVMLQESPKPLAVTTPEPFRETGPLPKLGGAKVAILDEFDKVNPRTGAIIPSQPESYWSANHLWSAKQPLIRLYAGRNEFVGFQVVLRGRVRGVRPLFAFENKQAAQPHVQFGKYVPIVTKIGPLPDPIEPLDDEAIDVDGVASIHVEIFVPRDTRPGLIMGTLFLTAGDERVEIPIELKVWDIGFSQLLSFLPEMNCYDLPANERDYYRLAHEHQTVLNRVPYYQNGRMAEGCAPRWDGKKLDFAEWDKRFGPLLDGSAFVDCERGPIPIECFYLPINENWPTPIEPNYNGDYWADRAFTPAYRQALVEVSRQFAEHLQEREWTRTYFEFFLNGKNDFKRNGWSRGSSPWLLDEPANFQDYWALRWFGLAFHEGVAEFAKASPHRPWMYFRADISRPQWQREVLDELLDYAVVSSSFRRYNRVVLDRKGRDVQRVLEYGSTNSLEQSNMQPIGWCIDSWSLGADGVVPWQTVGTEKSWTEADPLALFYPGRKPGDKPVPSIRLKAYRRGEQAVEYFQAYLLHGNLPRWALAKEVRQVLKLDGKRSATDFSGGEDAGRVDYDTLRPQDEWALRVRLGELLSAKSVTVDAIAKALPPTRDNARLAKYYVEGLDPVATLRSSSPNAVSEGNPAGQVLTFSGREYVRDALIDPARPDTALGSQPRENALSKNERTSVFLVRFEPAALAALEGKTILKAELCLNVWDPSSQGRTKLVARPIKSLWSEQGVTWNSPSVARRWSRGAFDPELDASAPAGQTIVEPDTQNDIAEPPLTVYIELTALVRDWAGGRAPNNGVALVPVSDRSIDDGNFTRFQVYASEHAKPEYGPMLRVLVGLETAR